ncbi:MarR family winged helix-turn-helix transcriptional regulator [Herbaspirillum sp. alder98]|uniref:MarR family winged helix-turn-helix transcriptional regulator n=1 Tax=Herbaspirillum sp. alder98 TaxID=2913096 RepID=UPI0039BC391C
MSFIDRGGKVRSTDLAEAFGFAPRTITEAVDALERDGMVLREPDLNDRRVKQISLTALGEEVLKASEPERTRFGNRLFEALEQDEISELAALLRKLNSRLGELEEELADAGGRGKK